MFVLLKCVNTLILSMTVATEVSSEKEGKCEEDVIREFSEKLTFGEVV